MKTNVWLQQYFWKLKLEVRKSRVRLLSSHWMDFHEIW